MRWGTCIATAAVVLTLAAIVPAARAQQQVDCDNAGSTVEINRCTGAELQQVDKQLNDVYRELVKRIGNEGGDPPYDAKSWLAALKTSQRAWIAFRDADCVGLVAVEWTGGSGTTAAINLCKIALTRARTKALEDRYGIK